MIACIANRGTTYNEMSVAIGIVNAGDSWPEFSLEEPRHGVGCSLAGVGAAGMLLVHLEDTRGQQDLLTGSIPPQGA